LSFKRTTASSDETRFMSCGGLQTHSDRWSEGGKVLGADAD